MEQHVYIHGLNSSGKNNNTSKLIHDVLQHENVVFSPTYQCDKSFDENVEDLIDQIKSNVKVTDSTIIFGSSLGGVYAERLAERLHTKCVLINPVVEKEQLNQFVGEQTNFADGKRYRFTEQLIESYNFEKLNTIPTIVFASNNDEVLNGNFDKVNQKYQRRAQVVQHFGGHRLSNVFKAFVDEVRMFENWFVAY